MIPVQRFIKFVLVLYLICGCLINYCCTKFMGVLFIGCLIYCLLLNYGCLIYYLIYYLIDHNFISVAAFVYHLSG